MHFRQKLARLLIASTLAITGTLVSAARINAASTATLKTVTTDDKTATVGVPDGWKLAKGANGYVYVKGPHSEAISLGAVIIAKNAPVGTSGLSSDIAFALPFSASLKDKLTMAIDKGAAKAGFPAPQVTIASQTGTKLPMCTMFLGGLTSSKESSKFEAVICSLRPDYLGLYKNIVFMAKVPSSVASTDRPIVQQIVQSYRVTPTMFKKMLSPYTAPPPQPPSGVVMPVMAPYQDPTNSDCFDYNIIRESPPWEVPMHCGGLQPG
ncbi:MAG TPA: hypothetical protein VFO25_05765 [Candidatus Eremiobacteraceae bacterium]|nr:hypothetical protein [Candidatus Eremiobacteraceae bacterium]